MARKRLFFGGSRQAPDPYDQFLEERGFYRKHTARDASCLFRVVSEQLYDTQLNHSKIREECIIYMKRNHQKYEESVYPKIFDTYLEDLSKVKTYGTLLELKVLAYRYQSNVLLFEAFNVGRWYVKEAEFKKCFKVFFTPEKHFDSIYDNNYIEDLAFTQGLCYEILYRQVFNLPDIMYAVERMLHDPLEDNMQYKRKVINKKICDIVTSEGRDFILDRPENTSCILDNYELCHFHNKDFALFATNLKREAEMCKCNHDRYKINRKLESLLPDKSISCVRQLLNEGITPFPYKVAKGLDVDIYRNIEFDAWSDFRKYKRIQYTTSRLQVGLKCHVRLRSSTSSLYNCHIQEITGDNGPCLVYVEELGEKKLVPYGRLEVPEKRGRWDNVTYRVKRTTTNKKNEFDGKASYQKMHRDVHRGHPYLSDNGYYGDEVDDDPYMAMKEYNNFRNFVAPPPYEFVTMPIVRSDNSYNKKGLNDQNLKSTEKYSATSERKDEKEPEELPQHSEMYTSCEGPFGYYEQVLPFPFDPNIPPPQQVQPHYLPAPVPAPNYNHGFFYNPVYSTGQTNTNAIFSSPTPGNLFGSLTQNPLSGAFIQGPVSNETAILIPIKRKELLQTHLPINFGINPSYNPSGHDIPTQDIVSVRFFYNLGHEYFKHLHTAFGMQGIMNLIHGGDVFPVMYDPPELHNSDVKALANEMQMGLSLKESETTTAQQQQQPSPKAENVLHGRRYNKNSNNSSNPTNKKDFKSSHSTKHAYSGHKGSKCSSKKDVKDQSHSPTSSAAQVQLEVNYTNEYAHQHPDEHGQMGYVQYIPYPQYQTYNPYNTFERENITYVMQPTYVPTTYTVSPGVQQQNVESYGYGPLDNAAAIESTNYSYPMLYPASLSANTPQPGQLWYPPTYTTLIPVAQPPLVIPGAAGTYNTSMNASSVSQ